jgi:hypothetical protein
MKKIRVVIDPKNEMTLGMIGTIETPQMKF